MAGPNQPGLVDDIDGEADGMSGTAGHPCSDSDGVSTIWGGSRCAAAASHASDCGEVQQQEKEEIWQSGLVSAHIATEAATEADQRAEQCGECDAGARALPWGVLVKLFHPGELACGGGDGQRGGDGSAVRGKGGWGKGAGRVDWEGCTGEGDGVVEVAGRGNGEDCRPGLPTMDNEDGWIDDDGVVRGEDGFYDHA